MAWVGKHFLGLGQEIDGKSARLDIWDETMLENAGEVAVVVRGRAFEVVPHKTATSPSHIFLRLKETE